jgi:serine/threonine-protein kinase
VPDLVGVARADAENAISSLGLSARISGSEFSDTLPAGAVISQSPVGGSAIDQGSQVSLTLSSGPAPIDIAALDAVDRPRDAVVAELTSLGLNVVLIDEGSATIIAGNVTRTDPDDEASPGDDVSVYVSVGDRVLIPASLQGEPLGRVRTSIENSGLEVAGEIPVSRNTLDSAGVDLEAAGIANGDVVGIQDNGARFGGWVDRGSSVTLIYYDEDLAE